MEVRYEEGMAASVYVKSNAMHKSDYVLHYAVKGPISVEEYTSVYDNKKNYMPTIFNEKIRTKFRGTITRSTGLGSMKIIIVRGGLLNL